ncbi:MAG: hypothetical protein ACI9CO_002064 [Candidatus Azotimanducaceae bacterium]|jgi:hypothetical protein
MLKTCDPIVKVVVDKTKQREISGRTAYRGGLQLSIVISSLGDYQSYIEVARSNTSYHSVRGNTFGE